MLGNKKDLKMLRRVHYVFNEPFIKTVFDVTEPFELSVIINN